jgi:glutamate synthase (NADPH/NADH) small chain
MATAFLGEDGRVTGVRTIDMAVSGIRENGKPRMAGVPGTERDWPADLVLLAIGFTGPETDTIVRQYGLALDARGRVRVDDRFMTSRPGVFAAGDARLGASLIVWAIAEGREAARGVDRFLMGRSFLPTKGEGDLPGPA